MKSTKILFLAVVCLLFSKGVSAQVSLGGQLNFTNYAGAGVHNLGIGVHGDLTRDRWVYRLTLNYALPSKAARTFDLYYTDSWGGDTYASSINGHEKYSGLGLWIDANYYFTGDGEDGGFYGLFGVGLSMVSVSYDMESYDQNTYHTYYDYTKKDRLFQPIIRLGLGYDFHFDFGNVFVQAFGNLPANRVNGTAVDVNLPFSFGGAAGVRIPIN